MGYSFVLFDVSLVISRGYFHCFFIGHTQNMYSPWAKSYFPVGKSSSGTATINTVTQKQDVCIIFGAPQSVSLTPGELLPSRTHFDHFVNIHLYTKRSLKPRL